MYRTIKCIRIGLVAFHSVPRMQSIYGNASAIRTGENEMQLYCRRGVHMLTRVTRSRISPTR